VDGTEEEVERVAGQEFGHLAHAAGVVVDLEAEPDRDGRPGAGGGQDGVEVPVEIAGGVGGPVGGGLGPEAAVGVGVHTAGQEAVGLAEAEEVIGDADLLHAAGGGGLGVGAHRIGPVGPVLPVAEQMQVIIQHLLRDGNGRSSTHSGS